jgi:hypothetical protein
MNLKPLRRSALVLILGLTLGGPAAQARPLSWESALQAKGKAVLRLFDVLLRGTPPSIRPKARCGIDPNGVPFCVDSATPLPLPLTAPKHGCGIDADGRTVCTP